MGLDLQGQARQRWGSTSTMRLGSWDPACHPHSPAEGGISGRWSESHLALDPSPASRGKFLRRETRGFPPPLAGSTLPGAKRRFHFHVREF